MQKALLKITEYITAYNEQNVAGMMVLLTDDVHFTHIANGEIVMKLTSKIAFEQQALKVLPMFSKRTQTIVSFNYNPPSTTVDIHFSATAAIDLDNGIKAGEMIVTNVKSIFTFNDNLINTITDIA